MKTEQLFYEAPQILVDRIEIGTQAFLASPFTIDGTSDFGYFNEEDEFDEEEYD